MPAREKSVFLRFGNIWLLGYGLPTLHYKHYKHFVLLICPI